MAGSSPAALGLPQVKAMVKQITNAHLNCMNCPELRRTKLRAVQDIADRCSLQRYAKLSAVQDSTESSWALFSASLRHWDAAV